MELNMSRRVGSASIRILESTDSWRENAACRGRSDLFYSERIKELQFEAERMCWNDCPVQKECLTHAVKTRQNEGTWGGFTGRKILREGARWLKNLK